MRLLYALLTKWGIGANQTGKTMAKIPPNSHRLLQAWRSHLAFGGNVRSDRPLDGDVCICKIVIEFGGIFAIVFPAWWQLKAPSTPLKSVLRVCECCFIFSSSIFCSIRPPQVTNRGRGKEMQTSEICNLRSKTVDSAFMLASQLELIEKKKKIFKARNLT